MNVPVCFHEYVAHAAEFGLTFLAEADFSTMAVAELPEAARIGLEALRGDPVVHGQHLDFVKCRRFRETLLRLATTPAAGAPGPGSVRNLLAASAATPDSHPAVLAAGVESRFRWGEGASLKAGDPPAKAALLALRECWPERVAFGALLDAACSLLGREARPEDEDSFEAILVGAFGLRRVESTAERWRCVAQPGVRPRVSVPARQESETGDLLAPLAHRRVRIDEPLALHLLKLCGGTRDEEQRLSDLGAQGHDFGREPIRQRLAGFAKLGRLEG